MSKAAFTIRAFGFYLLALGAVLILAPNVLLSLLFMPMTTEVWIRVVGVLVFNFGVYYLFAAKCEATAFAVFWLLGLAKPMSVFFGTVDFLGGLWTWQALKSGA